MWRALTQSMSASKSQENITSALNSKGSEDGALWTLQMEKRIRLRSWPFPNVTGALRKAQSLSFPAVS